MSPSRVVQVGAATTGARLSVEALASPSAFRLGPAVDGAPVANLGAVWAVVNTGGAATFDIPHKLGRVPDFVMFVQAETSGAAGNVAVACGVSRDQWTPTTAKGKVALVSGASLAGTVVTFIVG